MSLMRAWVVKRWNRNPVALLLPCSGFLASLRRSRHCRPGYLRYTANSRASACMYLQPPIRRASPARGLRRRMVGVQVVHHQLQGLVLIHQFRTMSRSWCAGVTSTRRHPSRGANSMNRLLKLRWVIVGPGCPGPRREGRTGLLQVLAGRPDTPGHCPGIHDDRPPARPPWRTRGAALGREVLSQGSSFFSEAP